MAVSLAERIGSGGEGTVYAVQGSPDLVAKLYTSDMTPERRQKLATMVSANTGALSQITAWPSELLFSNSKTVGFLMPRAKRAQELHVLYGMKSRKAAFPDAGFKFLVHSAMNIARAFAVVHQHGIVIGDVNERLALVGQDATVRLIDCDSFQFTHSGYKYYCDVGTPIFIPPELQGAPSLRGVERTEQHDVFGLAVLIFHILFLGKHPFAGICPQLADITLEVAIQQHRYAYSVDRKRTLMQAPPNSPPPVSAGLKVAKLFERAFSPSASSCSQRRPSSAEWSDTLHDLLRDLVNCNSNAAHSYASTFKSCPWCDVEANSRLELFNFAEPAGMVSPSIDVDAIMHAIGALPSLWIDPAPDLNKLVSESTFSADAALIKAERLKRQKITQSQKTRELAALSLAKTEAALEVAKQAELDASSFFYRFEADKLHASELAEQLRSIDKQNASRRVFAVKVALSFACVLPFLVEPAAPYVSGKSMLVGFAFVLSTVGIWLQTALNLRRNSVFKKCSAQKYLVDAGIEPRRKALNAARDATQHGQALLLQMQAKHYQALLEETAAKSVRPPSNVELAEAERRIIAAHKIANAKYLEAVHQFEALDKELAASRITITELSHETLRMCNEVKGIEARKVAERHAASHKAREVQLTKYLDRFFITRQTWPKIPPSALSQLASFGIETAADLNEKDLQDVPGFGPVRIGMLMTWRRQRESGFSFDPASSDHMSSYKPLERQLNSERRQVERKLSKVDSQLETLAIPLLTRRQSAELLLQEASSRISQTLKDMQVLDTITSRPRPPRITQRLAAPSATMTSGSIPRQQATPTAVPTPSSKWHKPKAYRPKKYRKRHRRRRY